MDRFESNDVPAQGQLVFGIYIPIWIDLKGYGEYQGNRKNINLHSNMDRFERFTTALKDVCFLKFTFQYG